MPPFSAEQLQAIHHIAQRLQVDGDHSLSSCPRGSRALCKYAETIHELGDDLPTHEEIHAWMIQPTRA